MSKSRRTTVYLEPDLHRALKLKSIETDSSISDLVNDAVRRSLLEGAEDLAVLEERAAEDTVPYSDFVITLERMAKREGRTEDELFGEMVRVYRREKELEVFDDLAAYGRDRARASGAMTEKDVERLIHEARGD